MMVSLLKLDCFKTKNKGIDYYYFNHMQLETLHYIFTKMAATREKRSNAGNKMSHLLEAEDEDEFYKTTYGGFNEVKHVLILQTCLCTVTSVHLFLLLFQYLQYLMHIYLLSLTGLYGKRCF